MKKQRSTPCSKPLIVKEMTINEVINRHPEIAFVLINHNLPCMGCVLASRETIEEAATLHGIDLRRFLKDLNGALKPKKRGIKK